MPPSDAKSSVSRALPRRAGPRGMGVGEERRGESCELEAPVFASYSSDRSQLKYHIFKEASVFG